MKSNGGCTWEQFSRAVWYCHPRIIRASFPSSTMNQNRSDKTANAQKHERAVEKENSDRNSKIGFMCFEHLSKETAKGVRNILLLKLLFMIVDGIICIGTNTIQIWLLCEQQCCSEAAPFGFFMASFVMTSAVSCCGSPTGDPQITKIQLSF